MERGKQAGKRQTSRKEKEEICPSDPQSFTFRIQKRYCDKELSQIPPAASFCTF